MCLGHKILSDEKKKSLPGVNSETLGKGPLTDKYEKKMDNSLIHSRHFWT